MMDVVLERHDPCDERSPMLDDWSGHISKKKKGLLDEKIP
jgi:hypothetical protein